MLADINISLSSNIVLVGCQVCAHCSGIHPVGFQEQVKLLHIYKYANI